MADWTAQISYNYNPSYHAYSYGLVYQPGPEQNHGAVTCWGETGVTDMSNYHTEVTQAYDATPRTREESPPGTPEQLGVNAHHHYQSTGVVYLGDTQAGRLVLDRPQRGGSDARANWVRRAWSDSTSDSEAQTPPDSWSCSISREGNPPQADPATWVKKNLDTEASSGSPIARRDVSSSLMEERQTFAVTGNEGTNNITSLYVPITATNKPSTTVVNNPKGKVRAAFSESQMNALLQRFSVQRYLTPAEMKNLAEQTGLTYKQVKTWFQNRRMKLRRHQKDTSWVSERYTINKDSPVNGTIYTNISSHIPPYKGDNQPQLKEHYNQYTMEATFKKTAPQNLAFYLAAMGGAAGSAGYPSWSSAASQTVVPNKLQATGWSMPPGVSYYEYNPSAFFSTANDTGHDMSLETKDEEPVNSQSSLNTAISHNANQ